VLVEFFFVFEREQLWQQLRWWLRRRLRRLTSAVRSESGNAGNPGVDLTSKMHWQQ
jgi:predicted PurR-regulated permease PerM